MSITGYCSNAALARFMDLGNWREFEIEEYDPLKSIYLRLVSDSNELLSIIEDTISVSVNGVFLDQDEFSVNLDTGLLEFDTTPIADARIVVLYYVTARITNADLTNYALLGARRLEKDANAVFRELITEYVLDGNKGYDYINFINSTTLELPYNVLEVEELRVNDKQITSFKVKGNVISLTHESGARLFPGTADSVYLKVVHGIPNEASARTAEQNRMLHLAEEANKCISAIMLIDSPLGNNIALDNSYTVQRSDGSIRPDSSVSNLLYRLEKQYKNLVSTLQTFTATLI